VLGLGKEPTVEQSVVIYALLHSKISKVISFTNPFEQPLKITMNLEVDDHGHHHQQESGSVFQLIMKKKRMKSHHHPSQAEPMFAVAPNSSLQIPIFFSPKSMRKYSANLIVSTVIQKTNSNSNSNNSQISLAASNDRELVWNYPIIGLAECKLQKLFHVKCSARQSFHKLWSIELDNYHSPSHPPSNEKPAEADADADADDDEFTIDLETVNTTDGRDMSRNSSGMNLNSNNNRNSNILGLISGGNTNSNSSVNTVELMNQIIDQSLQIDLVKSKVTCADMPKDDDDVESGSSVPNIRTLQIEILFEPLRPFHGMAKLQIMNKVGVRWVLPLRFDVSSADVDDVIRIEAQLHCTNSVSFRLHNPFGEATPFDAYFTTDSPFEFSVQPSNGILPVAEKTANHSSHGRHLDNDSSDQQFVISFTPHEYGSALNGKLIIQTSIMEWSFAVIGTHPLYVPPNKKNFESTIDHRMSAKTKLYLQRERQLSKQKNFLKQNITATSHVPHSKK
jgi:hypothetical protein